MEGVIKWYNARKGFGFIEVEDGKDVFFHRSALKGLEFDSLREGQSLEFEVKEESRGPRTVDIRSSEKIEKKPLEKEGFRVM
jgi:CspA family cold shock protein